LIKIINIVALMIVPLMVPAAGAKPAAAVPAPAVPAVAMAATLPMATVYFEVGSAELPADVATTLDGIVVYARANPGAKLAISGFHDMSGSQYANAELAKNRALAVRDALQNVGIGEERFELRKPELTTGSGDPAEARRVEVTVM
ncbi:MAG: OmpA family protein, partial [Candidatus Accumulibacter sp.]|nr:OmpA family protein [Accumulibacter sp.]